MSDTPDPVAVDPRDEPEQIQASATGLVVPGDGPESPDGAASSGGGDEKGAG
jgi:hypothetical protein